MIHQREPMDPSGFRLTGRETVWTQTQQMLDFCGKHNIVCDIEEIRADQINEAYERAIKSDVKYRFVIDTATI